MHQTAPTPISAPPTPSWVETTLESLSQREKIAQLFHVQWPVNGSELEKDAAFRKITQERVGGIFTGCWSKSYRQCRSEVQAMEAELPIPLLVSGDHESGCRIREGTPFGAAMTLAAVENLDAACEMAYEVGKHTAKQGRAFGTCWTFAPVVDLNLNLDNPITNTRSFGDQPVRVGRLAAAYVRGLQDHGMAATLKHFPGDGVDSRDQHIVTSVNTLKAETWRRTFAQTFQMGMEAGAMSVMMGHIALEWASQRVNAGGIPLPATVDPWMYQSFLRRDFGYDGVIISDAIGMTGLSYLFKDEADLVVAVLAAGADTILFVHDITACLDAMEEAVENGIYSQDQLNDSVRRVLRMKQQLELTDPTRRFLPEKEAEAVFADPDAGQLSLSLAEQAVTLIRDRQQLYPAKLSPGADVLLVELPLEYDVQAKLVVGEEDLNGKRLAMQDALEARGIKTELVCSKPEVKAKAASADAIIYLFLSTPQAGRGNIRLARAALDLLDWSLIRTGKPIYFVSMGSPYVAWELSTLSNFVCLYSRQDNVQEAYVRALLGEIPFQGKLPVVLPNH